ncbi:DUF397 domain-containing protein [Streptomyces angustmyceticus]
MIHAHISEADWQSSTYSQSNGGECIQWAPTYAAAHGVVPVRDSKDPQGPSIAFSASEWANFVTFAKGQTV